MRARLSAVALCLSVAAFGCFNAESDIPPSNGGVAGGVAGGHHTGGGNGNGNGATSYGTASSGGGASSVGSTSSGSSSAGSTTSGGGSSSGGSSTGGAPVCMAPGSGTGGTNIIFDCDNVPFYKGTAESCPADWLGSQVLDFDTCNAICGASVQAVGTNGVTIEGTAQLTDPSTGQFHFCLPVNTTFETEITAPTYGDFYYGEIQGQLAVNLPSFGLLTTDELTAFNAFVTPKIDFSLGNLVAFVINVDGCGGGGAQAETGWTVYLTDQNGDAYPDGGYTSLYVDNTGFPNRTLSSTDGYGVVIIYNIDPSIAQFPTIHATNPNSGGCQVVNTQIGFTGRVQVGPNIFTEQGIYLE